MILELSRWRIGQSGYRHIYVDIFQRWDLLPVTLAMTSGMHLTKAMGGYRLVLHQQVTITTTNRRRRITRKVTTAGHAIIILRLTRTHRKAFTRVGGRGHHLNTALAMTGHPRLTTARRHTHPRTK